MRYKNWRLASFAKFIESERLGVELEEIGEERLTEILVWRSRLLEAVN